MGLCDESSHRPCVRIVSPQIRCYFRTAVRRIVESRSVSKCFKSLWPVKMPQARKRRARPANLKISRHRCPTSSHKSPQREETSKDSSRPNPSWRGRLRAALKHGWRIVAEDLRFCRQRNTSTKLRQKIRGILISSYYLSVESMM